MSRRNWTLIATILGSGLTFIDATVVSVALPALQVSLHATITDVQWVVEAYALFLGALILVGGSLGDQFGRKRVFLCGTVVFTLASIACGAATSPAMLIAARAAQGIGAAFLVPGKMAAADVDQMQSLAPSGREVQLATAADDELRRVADPPLIRRRGLEPAG